MTLKLQIDPIACTGHGLCADLLPELIELDEWGYPILADSVPPDLVAHARRAVNACPTLALRLARTQNQLTTRHQRIGEIRGDRWASQ
ncbi:MAG TPA: ferredoxin [Streptosporangiaceae bacterium]|jgi:ferredoxin|nr:ferredoxin [Streptosporangiaceae bacterium]